MEPDVPSARPTTPAGSAASPHAGGAEASRQPGEAPHNRLLAALPPPDRQRWQALLEPVEMPLGMVLYESGVMLRHAWFPTSAIVSLEYLTESGASAEIAMVGNEGLVGIPLFMGGGSTPGRAVVQGAGAGFRMSGPALRHEFASSAAVMKLLLSYTQVLIAQMAQTAVCNRHHTTDQQVCRWLLQALDRHAGPELDVTHEQIAHMLGVRREGVTGAALSLQSAGLISYRRGRITVVDRPGLEQRCCECYAVVQAEYERLLGPAG
jgi:CRP-like cAMP-binding protein